MVGHDFPVADDQMDGDEFEFIFKLIEFITGLVPVLSCGNLLGGLVFFI